VVVGQGRGGGGGYTYVGWSTDGATSDTPSSASLIAEDETRVNRWTASEGGTMKRLRVYFGSYVTAETVTACVYKNTTLVGTASITPSVSSWVWSSDLVAEDGQSLTFVTSNEIYFGIAVDNPSVNNIYLGYGGGVALKYYRMNPRSYLPATASWTEISSSGSYGVILEYE